MFSPTTSSLCIPYLLLLFFAVFHKTRLLYYICSIYSSNFKNKRTNFLSNPFLLNLRISILFFLIGKLLNRIESIISFISVSICKSLIIDSISSLIKRRASISISFPLQLIVNCPIVGTSFTSTIKSVPSIQELDLICFSLKKTTTSSACFVLRKRIL